MTKRATSPILAMARIPYADWVKWIWKGVVVLLVLGLDLHGVELQTVKVRAADGRLPAGNQNVLQVLLGDLFVREAPGGVPQLDGVESVHAQTS